MHISWDIRSIAKHMGGIAHAAAGWLNHFIPRKPSHWRLSVIHSSACDEATLRSLIPNLNGETTLIPADAGFIAPRFEQLQLPSILEQNNIDIYFNPGVTIPAIKTTRYQVSVIHDLVVFDQPRPPGPTWRMERRPRQRDAEPNIGRCSLEMPRQGGLRRAR